MHLKTLSSITFFGIILFNTALGVKTSNHETKKTISLQLLAYQGNVKEFKERLELLQDTVTYNEYIRVIHEKIAINSEKEHIFSDTIEHYIKKNDNCLTLLDAAILGGNIHIVKLLLNGNARPEPSLKFLDIIIDNYIEIKELLSKYKRDESSF